MNDLQGTYNALKTYRQTAPSAEQQLIDSALHDAEHLVANLCAGNSLQGSTIPEAIGAMSNLLPQ